MWMTSRSLPAEKNKKLQAEKCRKKKSNYKGERGDDHKRGSPLICIKRPQEQVCVKRVREFNGINLEPFNQLATSK